MYQHLLVPLDGSVPAEAALAAARALVERAHMPVTLLHVVETDAPPVTHAGRHLRAKAEAEAYLADVARRFFAPGMDVRCHVHTAASHDVAAEIAGHPFELAADLVVMSPHGRGGFHGARLGNMAQQVLSLGHTPVLMVRNPGPSPETPWCPKVIFFPHAGDPVHERALPVAEEWTRLFGGLLKLVMVVPTTGTLGGVHGLAGTLLPGGSQELLDIEEQSAAREMETHVIDMKGRGVEAEFDLRRGDPAEMLVQCAKASPPDLVIMGTHGRAGSKAFWNGSVAARLVTRLDCSCLLIPLDDTRR